MNMDDIFSNFGDVFGDFFGGGSTRSRGGAREQGVRGSNLRIKVKLTLEEIAKGVQKKVKVNVFLAPDQVLRTVALLVIVIPAKDMAMSDAYKTLYSDKCRQLLPVQLVMEKAE